MTYVKQMWLVKKTVVFQCPGWRQWTEVGTGLRGQLPFAEPAKTLSTHALEAPLPAFVQRVRPASCNYPLRVQFLITLLSDVMFCS